MFYFYRFDWWMNLLDGCDQNLKRALGSGALQVLVGLVFFGYGVGDFCDVVGVDEDSVDFEELGVFDCFFDFFDYDLDSFGGVGVGDVVSGDGGDEVDGDVEHCVLLPFSVVWGCSLLFLHGLV